MTSRRGTAWRPSGSGVLPRLALGIGDWPRIAVAAATGVAAIWVATLLFRRLDGLGTGAYDLGFFQQVIWNVRTNGAWVSSFSQGSFLGLHFSPILLVPAAIQGLTDADAHLLSLLHALGIGALAPAAFLFLREAFRPSPLAAALAAGIAVGIPVWAAMQWVIRSDFHPELVGVVLALLAGWAGLAGRARTMWVLAALALTTREDVAYAIAVVGVVVAVRGHGRMRMHGWALVAAAVIWGVTVFGLLMPWLRDGVPSDTARYYRWLGPGPSILTAPLRIPDQIMAALVRPAPWFVVAGMVAALAGLPLLRPRWLLPLVLPLAALLLSGHPPQAAVIFHYPLILVTPILAAAAMGGRRALAIAGSARRRRRRARRRTDPTGARQRLGQSAAPLVFAIVAVPAVIDGFVQGSIPPFVPNDPVFVGRPPAIEALRAIAATVPLDAPLVADEGLVTPLAARPAIRRLTALGLPTRDAFVIIDGQAWSPSRDSAARRDRILVWLRASGRPIVADDGRFVVWGPQPTAVAP